MVYPDQIDLVSLIYSLAKSEREKHKREEGVVWVTDLVRCPLKRLYEERYPELSLSELFKPTLILGSLVHRSIGEMLKEVLRVYVVETEVEGFREVAINDGSLVRVKGRLDILITGNSWRVAIEVKTARSDVNIPQRHHVDQVRAYNWLFDLNYSILLYITPSRITQFPVDDRMSDTEVAERVGSKKAPRYSWECSYCHYSVMCPNKVQG